jgi:hypothetical protein
MQFLMLNGQLPMNSMNLIDFILKSEPQRHLFIEGLLSLFIILQQHILIILKMGILLFEQFQLLKDLSILLLIDLLIILNHLLPSLNLFPQLLHLTHLIPLNFSDHRFEVTL